MFVVALLGRILKSTRNRASARATQLRGAWARGTRPGVLEGGEGVSIGRNVALVIYGKLVLGKNVILSDGCALEVGSTGRLVLGDNAFIGRHAVVRAQELIELGEHVLVAEHCTIRDQDHQTDPEARRQEVKVETGPISIGPQVWIGAGVRVLRGSSIGEGSVVAANAVVRGHFPARVVIGGIPARVLRELRPTAAATIVPSTGSQSG